MMRVVVGLLSSESVLPSLGGRLATAARTDAVRNASVIGSMSTRPIARSCPRGGPVTVVSVSVCTTVQPMGSRTSVAKRASPWSDAEPMFVIVHVAPVIAATASGYVALLASLSMLYTGGLAYVARGMR